MKYGALRKIAGIGLAALLSAGCVGLVACSQETTTETSNPLLNTADVSGGVAATVNGVEIGENVVTAYVEKLREAQSMGEDDVWGQWMVDNGYTPEQVRSDTVDYYVSRELLRQAAKQEGVSVDESQVDENMELARASYDSDEAWATALEDYGIAEEVYRQDVELTLLQNALLEKIAPDAAATDDEVFSYIQLYDNDYADAASLADIPEDVVSQYRETADYLAKQSAFSEYMFAFQEKAEVTIADMPEGLPYDIDLAPYEQAVDAGVTNEDASVEGVASEGGSSTSDAAASSEAANGSEG